VEALIQIRRSTAAQWISANPILASGEPGLETDTRKGKYGDGVTRWVSLPYSWQSLSVGPSGPAGGSLAGTYPNPTLNTNVVGSPQIIDGSVGSAELATNAVTTVKIGDAQVNSTKLADNAVITAKITDSAVTSAKIADGTVALADLAAATVSALKVDVYDEGAVKQAEADRINFVGAGVAVTGAGGIATVTITGAPASAILPGTMAEWFDPTPPTGWYICDGSVHTDLAGTLGTRYGTTSGTVPDRDPISPDRSFTQAEVVQSSLTGYSVTACSCRLLTGWIIINLTVQRTGADVPLGNANYADQSLCVLQPNFWPDFSVGALGNNLVRHFGLSSSSGTVTTTAGLNTYTTSDINRDDVFGITFNYPLKVTNTLPKVYKIIKAP